MTLDRPLDPILLETARRRTPWPRLGQPQDIANAAVFLPHQALWVDETTQFFFARRSSPCASETVREIVDSGRRNHDRFGRIGFPVPDEMEKAKQGRAQH